MSDLPSLARRVRLCLERFGLPPSGVAAVSGGPDSVALLLALVKVRGPTPAGPLVIGHLNHQLRGAESDADEAFVRDLHAALVARGVPGLRFRSVRRDVRAEGTRPGVNLEGYARGTRYAALLQFALEEGLTWIATGHTADDQAETVLHHLLRGTGLKGLRGIGARRALSGTAGVELIRPLLSVTRADVLAFLEQEGQPYRQDSSNFDFEYTRNRIRHELIPHLKHYYNPAVVEALGRLAEQAGEHYATEERAAAAVLKAAELPRAGPVLVFDRRRLAGEPRHRVREVFRLAWQREGWPQGRMSFPAWDGLAKLVFGQALAVGLPGGIEGRALPHVVRLGPAS